MDKPNTKPLITVFGATGMQGGSVVDYLLGSGMYRIRGVTRKMDHPKARALAGRGVEMVQGDISSDNMEKLTSMMRGCHGIFLLTNYWDPSIKNKEVEIGKKLVDAAKSAGIRHLIWSTAANVEKISGKKGLPFFTDKAIVEEYITNLQRSSHPFECVTFVLPSLYYQSFQTLLPPKMEGDTVVFNIPETKNLQMFDVTELGLAVLNVFKNPKEMDGKRIDLCGSQLSPRELVDQYHKTTGMKARLNSIPRESYSKQPNPNAKELSLMFEWFNDYTFFGPNGDRDLGSKVTENKLSTWEQFLKRTKWTGTAASS
jgi:uncharacterized protein YbjT (DUF2867 family)